MTGILLPPVALRAVDANGVPMGGAKLQFYLTGTLTPSAVYTSAALTTPLPNPVVSDSTGLFPPMFRDPTVTYRAQLLTSGGSLVQDVDPVAAPFVNPSGSIVATMLAAGAAVVNIGYPPLNKNGDISNNLAITFTTLANNQAGYLGAPRNEQDGNYTLALGDAGLMVRHNSGSAHAYTIPSMASVPFLVGTTFVFRNSTFGAGVLTITRGAGVTLTIAGSGTNKDVAIAQYGFATCIMEDPNVWVISGVGLS